MCGRYVLALQPSEVRQQLEQSQMPVAEAPDDDSDVRQSYNFAPGYHGLVYRADGPEDTHDHENTKRSEAAGDKKDAAGNTKYKLQSMQWGLVPSWTKRNPDYTSKLKTINCRDDSLAAQCSMWTPIKKKKRCIIVAQGFYEWLKKDWSKEKIPHFIKRKDGQLMCFAGLWDCVQLKDSNETLFTYTIITTKSNTQLRFLHDRMPVILENGSDEIRKWLDPTCTQWNSELQSLLKPYQGLLEYYPVSKDVGKVGNDSPLFTVPISSATNENKITNFFGNQRAAATKIEPANDKGRVEVEHNIDENRATTDRVEGTEDNAPLPVPVVSGPQPGNESQSIKREHDDDISSGTAETERPNKRSKPSASVSPTKSPAKTTSTRARKQGTRSATSNGSAAKTPKSDGSRKITAFFSSK